VRSTASFKNKLKSFLFHAAYTGNTVLTLECANGLIAGGALQVTVVVTPQNVVSASTLSSFQYQLEAFLLELSSPQ